VVGANNNLIHPGAWGKLEQQVEAEIASFSGPIWGLEAPRLFPQNADQTLSFHRLQRTPECFDVTTNIEREQIRACRLARLGSNGQ
jgi:hypothetical protein